MAAAVAAGMLLPDVSADSLFSFPGDAWPVIVSLVTVLVVASIAGYWLKRIVAGAAPHAVIDNLNSRIKTWWIIVLLVGLALVAGRSGLCLLFAGVSCVALREFVSAGAPDCPRSLLLGCSLFLVPLQYFFVWNASPFLFSTLLPLLAGLPLLGALTGRGRDWLHRTRFLRAGLLICVFGVSHAPALVTLLPMQDAPGGWRLLVFLLIVVQASDVLQYLWGKLAGRHPLAPHLSPSKTVEGLIGGVVSACALGAALSTLTPFAGPWQAALTSFLLTFLGFSGGLMLSAVKRSRGRKDWGTLLPGHGGMLDRLDSLFLSAPALYYLLLYRLAS